jgi:hypothetical protein
VWQSAYLKVIDQVDGVMAQVADVNGMAAPLEQEQIIESLQACVRMQQHQVHLVSPWKLKPRYQPFCSARRLA